LGQRLGVDAYLTKPFEAQHLLDAIKTRLKRMQQIASLTEADMARMKQEIITVFSHELRTPLTYIVGYVNLLDDHRNIDAESIDEMIYGIKRGADRLVNLVEDLMLMMRIDSGVVAAEIGERRERVSLVGMIHEVLQDYDQPAQQRKVQIMVEIQE